KTFGYCAGRALQAAARPAVGRAATTRATRRTGTFRVTGALLRRRFQENLPGVTARYIGAMGADPAAVWKLVQRADELVKYAQNRNPHTAYAQARAVLDEA